MRFAAGRDGDRVHRQDLWEHQRVARPDNHRHGLQQDRNADTRDQRREARGVAQSTVGKAFHGHRQQGADGHGNHQGNAELQQLRHMREGGVQGVHGGERGERADHQNIAVSKVNNAQNAIHHGIAQRDQRVDASQHHTVDQLLYECIQRLYPQSARSAATIQ